MNLKNDYLNIVLYLLYGYMKEINVFNYDLIFITFIILINQYHA